MFAENICFWNFCFIDSTEKKTYWRMAMHKIDTYVGIQCIRLRHYIPKYNYIIASTICYFRCTKKLYVEKKLWKLYRT